MRSNKPAPLLIHGWTVFAHPLFLAQFEAIVQQVEGLKERDPVGYIKKNANKRLARFAAAFATALTESIAAMLTIRRSQLAMLRNASAGIICLPPC